MEAYTNNIHRISAIIWYNLTYDAYVKKISLDVNAELIPRYIPKDSVADHYEYMREVNTLFTKKKELQYLMRIL